MLLTLPGGASFGLSGFEWVALGKDGRSATVEVTPYAFLPLLELTEEAIDSSVFERARELAIASVPGFPHDDVVLAGLRSSSAYWEELAIARLRRRSDLMCFRDELLRVARSGSTQALRHEAERLVRR